VSSVFHRFNIPKIFGTEIAAEVGAYLIAGYDARSCKCYYAYPATWPIMEVQWFEFFHLRSI
jgi:hypothetical protein